MNESEIPFWEIPHTCKEDGSEPEERCDGCEQWSENPSDWKAR